MPRPASAGRVTIEEAQRPRVRPTDRVTRTRRLRQRRQSPIGLSLEQVEDLELLDAAGKKADQLIEEALLDAEDAQADGATAEAACAVLGVPDVPPEVAHTLSGK